MCEDVHVALAPPKGEELRCTGTIHGDTRDGPSDHSPSQEFVVVAMVPLPIKAWLSFLMGTAKVVGAANQVHSCFQCLHLPMRLRMYAYPILA